jgi:hypothetical protein
MADTASDVCVERLMKWGANTGLLLAAGGSKAGSEPSR